MVEYPLAHLRKSVYSNISTIMPFVDNNYILRKDDNAVVPDQLVYVFCGSKNSVTYHSKKIFQYYPQRSWSKLLNHLERKMQFIANDIKTGSRPYIIEEYNQVAGNH